MFIAFENKETGTARERIAQTIDAVVEHVISCGVAPEDAEKFRLLFRGKNPACYMLTPRVHIAHLPTICEDLGIGVNDLTGSLTIAPRNQKAYTIELDETKLQNLFLLCLDRIGDSQEGEDPNSFFPSFYLVCPETKGPLALAIAMEGTFDGSARNLEWASRMYISTTTLSNGRRQSKNALDTIDGKQNLEGLCFRVAQVSNFPVEKIRKNRQNADERRQSFIERQALQNTQVLAGAGAGRSSTVTSSLQSDPYADE